MTENTADMTAIVATAAAAAAAAAVRAAAPREITVNVETTVTVHSERATTTSTVTDELLQLQEQETDDSGTTAATAATTQQQQQQQQQLQPSGVFTDVPRTSMAAVRSALEAEQPELTARTAVSDATIASDEWADVMTGIAGAGESTETEQPLVLPLNVCSQEVPAIAGDFPCNLITPCITAVTTDADTTAVIVGTAGVSDRGSTITTATDTVTGDNSGTTTTSIHTAAEGDRVVYIPLSRVQHVADTIGTAAATAADAAATKRDRREYKSPTIENLGAVPASGAISRLSSSEESVYGDDDAKELNRSSSSAHSSGYSSDEGFQDSMQEEEQGERVSASPKQRDSPTKAHKIYIIEPAAAAAAAAASAAAVAEHPVPLRDIVAAAVARDAAALPATLHTAATTGTTDTVELPPAVSGAGGADATTATAGTTAARTGAGASSDLGGTGEQKEEQPSDTSASADTTADTADTAATTAVTGEETVRAQPDSTTTSTTASGEQQLTAAVGSVQHKTVTSEIVTKGTITFKSTAVASSPAVATVAASADMAPSTTVRNREEQQSTKGNAESSAAASQALTWAQVTLQCVTCTAHHISLWQVATRQHVTACQAV
jgi:trimeric autotransporter adhesin